MSASESEPGQDTRIARAKAFYNKVKADGDTRKLDAALHKFKEVSLRCPCNKTLLTSSRKVGLSIQAIPTPTCHCKDFVSLATSHGEDDEDSLAMYRLATKPCSCGSGIASCRSTAHIAALDGMTAVCEAQKGYAKAIQYASLLIVIFPHAPEGYLRMVKSLRLQARVTRADVTSQCMYILAQAATSTRTFGDKQHEKLKAIRQMLRLDPMRRFPVEVQQMVLEYLPYAHLCRALRVSKVWNQACRNPSLWMHLKFVRYWRSQGQRPFRPGVLNDIISKRAQNLARSLTITGMKEFAIDAAKLRSVLLALPRLESLSLSGSDRIQWQWRWVVAESLKDPFLCFSDTFRAICECAPRSLKVLRLDNFIYAPPQQSPWLETSTIDRISESLVEMSLTNLGHIIPGAPVYDVVCATLESTVWPKLEKLILKSGSLPNHDSCLNINIHKLVSNTPSLRDLTLHGTKGHQLDPDPNPVKSWKNLVRLNYGISDHRTSLAPLASPKLRSLELLNNGLKAYRQIFMTGLGEEPPQVWLENLEHFCCQKGEDHMMSQASYDFERIKPSSTNGTLRSLHISFNLTIRDELDKVLNKSAIHTLSCRDIITSATSDLRTSDDNSDAWINWVDTFPNLQTAGAYPSHQKDKNAWTIVVKLLGRRPDIKTIYTNALFGVFRDELLEQADKIGVKIIHADRVPEPTLAPIAPPPGPSLQLTAGQDGVEGSQDDQGAGAVPEVAG